MFWKQWFGCVKCPNKEPPWVQTKPEAGITSGLGGTEQWHMSTCRRRQVCVLLTDYPTQQKAPPTPYVFKTRLETFLASKAFYNAGEFPAIN